MTTPKPIRPRSARAAPEGFAARRFDAPSRLSPAELDALASALRKTLPELERDLALALRAQATLTLVELAEVGADLFTSNLMEAPLALRFEVAGQPGWLAWDRAAAVAALESALGAAEPGPSAARELSSVERGAFVRLTSGITAKLAHAAGLAVGAFRAAQDAEAIGSWRQGGERAEAHRLRARIGLDWPGGASELALYLPGIAPRAALPKRTRAALSLPAHLAPVEVEIAARLGASEIPLAELLALEVGDVIPLGVPLGAPVTIHVEDVPRMRGVLGRSGGELAVRISSIEPATADEPMPTEDKR